MPFADTKDREIAEKVIRVLQSEKYKAKNYVFLQPFDTSLTPGYTETIGKPLDLQTVSESLQKDLYDEFTFWKDLSNVFHNAIKYHGDKQTKWIAQYATSMLKYMNKERKKAEQGGSLENSFSETDPEKPKLKNKLKIKLKSSPESMKGMKESTDGKASPILSSNVSKPKLKIKRQEGDMASVHSSNSSEPALKKPKLKLKMAGSKPSEKTQESTSFGLTSAEGKSKISSEVRPGDGKEATNQEKSTQPTLKLKLSFKSKKSETSSVSSGKDSSSIKLIKKSSIESSDSNKMKNSELQQSKASSLAKSSNANTSVVAKFSSSKDKEDNKGSKSTSNKISVKLNPGNRGKELPKAVAASQQQDHAATGASSTVTNTIPKEVSQTKSSKKKNKLKLKKSVSSLSTTKKTSLDNTASLGDIMKSKTSNSSIQTSSLHGDQFPTDVFRKQCSKVLSGLRRRQQKNIKWFANPITDKKILPVYSAKIKNPMDMQSLQSNLEKGVYNESIPAFCLDLRRIFANALQFNTLMKDMIRPVAIEVLQTAEDLLKIFLSGDKVGQQNACPPLLYCWKLCIDILNTIYKLENPTDGQPLALYFFHPVTYYYLGETPPGYSEKVKKPMDFGTVCANLIEGRYQAVDSFANDCRLIINNCITYYEGRDDGKVYVDQANKLNECLSQQLDQLSRYDKSPKASSDRLKAKDAPQFAKPPPSLFLSILTDLRALKYTDKATKITQSAMAPFEDPVSLSTYPDYMQYIQEKMDLQSIERKVKTAGYDMTEDFEYDVFLVFNNYEVYNLRRNAHHAIGIAKFAAKKFRLLFITRMRYFEDPTSMPPPKMERQDSTARPEAKSGNISPSPPSSSPPGKKIKIDGPVVAKKKVVPRISITAANTISAPPPAPSPAPSARSKSPAPKKPPLVAPVAAPGLKPKLKPNQPVPLHIAIARVKEGFPIRRAVKTLQSWEADCARYFKELMRHPWIAAARPKFIFHVPVPVLFPDLSDSYAAKIKYPMDLTTIECSLLSGSKYSGPEDFVNDVALVFTNAIAFNKDGRDIGDPLSCAYYDASVHLLRYSRWLSLEILTDYDQDIEGADLPTADGLPPFSWSITQANRIKAREEMESLVLKEPIDVSLEGDRWTWHEAECEKLLKALRHQSDLKYMTFFISPNYPHDYAAYISKPMDWEKVQRMLKKRQYRVFGDFIEDLRLIFRNALKYNAKHQGTDNVSGLAYEAAIYMSTKLESAVHKMVINVSDRLERERIDHANAEREIEAAERAEEAQIRAAWKKEPDSKEGVRSLPSNASNLTQKIRNIRGTPLQQNTDFEIPFFDEEDDGQHESSYFEVVKFQKAMFEKQRQELVNMRKISKSIGLSVIDRQIKHQIEKQRIEDAQLNEEKKRKLDKEAELEKAKAASDHGIPAALETGSSVLAELEREDRGPLQMKLKTSKLKRAGKRKMPFLKF